MRILYLRSNYVDIRFSRSIAIGALFFLSPIALIADNCGSTSDCYGTAQAAFTVIGALLVATVLAGVLGLLFVEAAGAATLEAAGVTLEEAFAAEAEQMAEAERLIAEGERVAEGNRLLAEAERLAEADLQSVVPSEQGKILGWGDNTDAGVQQTETVTANLTSDQVQQMIDNGLNKQYLEKIVNQYTDKMSNPQFTELNRQAIPRFELLQKVLNLWPSK